MSPTSYQTAPPREVIITTVSGGGQTAKGAAADEETFNLAFTSRNLPKRSCAAVPRCLRQLRTILLPQRQA